jgi:hypothetical protein
MNIGNNYYPLFNTGSSGSFRSFPTTLNNNVSLTLVSGSKIEIGGIYYQSQERTYDADSQSFIGSYPPYEPYFAYGSTITLSNTSSTTIQSVLFSIVESEYPIFDEPQSVVKWGYNPYSGMTDGGTYYIGYFNFIATTYKIYPF